MAHFPRPLDNHPLVRSREIDEVREALARVYARPILKIAPGHKSIDATMNDCRLRHAGLAYAAYGGAVEVEYPAAGSFVLLLPMRGHGQLTTGSHQVSMAVGSSATISPDIGFRASYDPQYEFLVLKIDRQPLTNKLLALTGATVNEPLYMDPHIDVARPETRLLREYLPLLAGTLSTADRPMPDWWIAQTEQLLMVMFLCGHRHNYSHLLEQPASAAAPFQIRRAEEYIEANAEHSITLEDLAQISGVSAFSLFRTFKRTRGYSPLEFINRIRSKYGGLS